MGGYRWSKEDEKTLEELYGNAPVHVIKAKLSNVGGKPRTYNSIRKKAEKLGLDISGNRCEFITAGDLSECMGYCKSVILRNWKKWGLKISFVVLVSKKKISKIEVNDFWRFAYDNREKIDFSRYKEGSLIPEPKWLREELSKKQVRLRKPIDQYTEMQIIALRNLGVLNAEIENKVGLTATQLQCAIRSLVKRGKLEKRQISVSFSEHELKLIKKMVLDDIEIKYIAEEVGRSRDVVHKKIRTLKKSGKWNKIEVL